jgi:integrase
MKAVTGNQNWIFPSARNDGKCMSENAVRVALRSMGYGNEDMTAHGFRAMASTVLNNNGFPRDHIERQLAHAEENAVRAAYNHAEYLPQRREMMQWWADWLEGPR